MNTSKAKEWTTCEPGPSFFKNNETMPTSSSTELERARLCGFITGVIVATLIFTLAVFLTHHKPRRIEPRPVMAMVCLPATYRATNALQDKQWG